MPSKKSGSTKTAFVDNYFLYLLAAASEAISTRFHAQLRAQSIRVRDWRVLSCLSDRQGLMVTDLAKRTLYEQSHVTKIIDDLEAEGLVLRRIDKEDKRRTRVHITEAGMKHVRPLIEQAREHEKEVLSVLDPDEKEAIFKILRKFIE